MPKKARGARREARRMEAEIISLRAELGSERARTLEFMRRYDEALRANIRLSQDAMRTAIRRDGDTLEIAIRLHESTAREFRYEPHHLEAMLGSRLRQEIEIMSYRKSDIFPLPGSQPWA